MILRTHTDWAPWTVVPSDDKRRARLNVISHLLSQFPYDPLPAMHVKLPGRKPAKGYEELDLSFAAIPEVH